jgi:hypothetical protein
MELPGTEYAIKLNEAFKPLIDHHARPAAWMLT